jgi:hypothetical protein
VQVISLTAVIRIRSRGYCLQVDERALEVELVETVK